MDFIRGDKSTYGEARPVDSRVDVDSENGSLSPSFITTKGGPV